MPRETPRDFWWTYRGSEGWLVELTPAQPADNGTSQPSPALVVPSGSEVEMNTVWDGREWTKLTMVGDKVTKESVKLPPTEEELKKHVHNPRGLGRPTVPALNYFKKDLPEIGSAVFLQTMTGRMAYSLSTAATVHQNDEETVYFITEGNLQGYICSCYWCRKCWTKNFPFPDTANADLRADWERRTRSLNVQNFSPQYIGHLGAIRRAYDMDLPVIHGAPEVAAGYHCHMRNMAPYGMLRSRNNGHPYGTVLYAVPEFGEESRSDTMEPEDPVPIEWPSALTV